MQLKQRRVITNESVNKMYQELAIIHCCTTWQQCRYARHGRIIVALNATQAAEILLTVL
jgi:hypothetical protein